MLHLKDFEKVIDEIVRYSYEQVIWLWK
jgi:hypothetical protein